MTENSKSLSSSFDPTEWAEKRRLAMVKASELRDQRRRLANQRNPMPVKVSRDRSVVRAPSRESITSTEGGKWEIDITAPPKTANSASSRQLTTASSSNTAKAGLPNRRPVTKLAAPSSSRMRAVTSPAEKRRVPAEVPVRKPGPVPSATGSKPLRPLSATAPRTSRPVQQPIVKPTRSVVIKSARPAVSSVSSSDPSDPVTRQMIDRDTLRRDNKALFARAIAYWRSLYQAPESQTPAEPGRACVYIRKRPLFDKESSLKGEYDVVTVPHAGSIVVHNCLFQADLKTPYLMHSTFNSFTRCFDETASNEDVFALAALRLVEHALEGGVSTIFCFGQTGSGKTHTMTAVQDLTSQRILGTLTQEVSIQIVELCGKKVFDLLSTEKSIVKLREAGDGSLVLDGASVATARAAYELASLMQTAQDRRNTESTGANDVSSRSHVVAIISLSTSGGKLTLVDLAGSERRKDSMWHDKERQKEGAEINASLHALKECIRNANTGHRSSTFRLSTLTRILGETFTNPQAQLAVIATVSPCATDVEHTISTLKTVLQLSNGELVETKQTEMYPKPINVGEGTLGPPKKWTAAQVQEWLAREGEPNCTSISSSTTGAMLCRMPESRFIQACGGDERRGAKLFRSLHALIVERI